MSEPNAPERKGEIRYLWHPEKQQWVKPFPLPSHVAIDPPVWLSRRADCPDCKLLSSATFRISVWKDSK